MGLSDDQYAEGRCEWLVVLPCDGVLAWMPFKTANLGCADPRAPSKLSRSIDERHGERRYPKNPWAMRRMPSDTRPQVVYGYGLSLVWKIGHPTSVCHNDSSGVSEGPTR